MNFSLGQIVATVQRKFNGRKERLLLELENQQKIPYYDMINFEAYLYKNLPSASRQQVAYWSILNCCLREEHPAAFSLLTIEQDDPVYNHMHRFLQSFQITPQMVTEVKRQHQIYKEYLKKAEYVLFFLAHLNEQDWVVALQAFLHYRRSLPGCHAELNPIPNDANRVFVLYCTSMAAKCMVDKDAERALKFARIAVVDGLQVIEQGDSHFGQMKQNLNRLKEIAKNVFSEAELNQYEELLA